jgi:hypothetical protein
MLQQRLLILSNLNRYNFTESQGKNIDEKIFRLGIVIRTCVSCKEQLLILTVEAYNGNSWEDIEKLGAQKILSKESFIVGFG